MWWNTAVTIDLFIEAQKHRYRVWNNHLDTETFSYFPFRFCVVILCLGLSVFSTIEGHEYEKEAEFALFNLEIFIVIWFGVEFVIR